MVVASRANLSRITTVLEAVRDHPSLQLQVIAAASALLDRFGHVVGALTAAGFTPDAKVPFIIEGSTPAVMARSTGLGLFELPTAFERLEPDVVVTVADRFETIATAIAAAYMNIAVAHTQGGEVSGSIDESVRHAITKLSHIHFPATDLSARRILAMGEDPRYVFNVGCPSIDLAARARLGTRHETLTSVCRSRSSIDPAQPFLLVMQHGVTTESGEGLDQMSATLDAVSSIGMQALVFWPNVDAGSADVAASIHRFRARGLLDGCELFSNVAPEDFIRLMAHCACMVGNSSAALREGAFLGTPAVCVGSRQQDRECGRNVLFTTHDPSEIIAAIRAQIDHGRYDRDTLFGTGRTGVAIAERLASVNPSVQKRLHYDTARLVGPVSALPYSSDLDFHR